jgi:UDP-N-acetylmuramate dehydrogenase
VLAFARANRVPWKVIGNGSNLLVSDQGFPGIVIRLEGQFSQVNLQGTVAEVGAGMKWNDLLEQSRVRGLAGAEFLWGIPGTLGGGIRTNAGAMGHELGELVTSFEVMTPDGEVQKHSPSSVVFSYRHSSLAPDLVVLSATLNLKAGNPDEVAARIAGIREKRQASQPRGASAGSVFKNPTPDARRPTNDERQTAGWLIDRAGLKGTSVGDAVVSEQHANFIINRNKARCIDVCQLIELIKLKVEEQFGVILEEEIEMVGALEEA